MAGPNETSQVTRDLPALSLRAAIRPGSLDPEKRTVELVWTKGARVLRGYFEPWYEELSLAPGNVRMGRLQNKAPFLNTHRGYDASEVLGVVESASIVDGEGRATVRFARAEDDAEADAIFKKIQDGILAHVSVGYRTYKAQKIEDGTTTIPVYRAVDWEPFEISVTPMGEDDSAGFRSATERTTNACVFEERTAMADPVAPPAVPAPVDVQPPKPDEQTRAARDEGATAERVRVATIRGLLARNKITDEALSSRLLGDAKSPGVPLDEARSLLLEHLAERSNTNPIDTHVRVEQGETDRDKFLRGAAASIFQRSGVADLVARAQKSERFGDHFRGVSLDAGEFRGMRLLDLARESLERRGVSTRGLHGEQLVKAALQTRDAGVNTSSDFAILLETAMYKSLLAAYATTPDTWSRFCARKNVSDFRTATFYRNGTFGTLDSLTESGEFKHKNVPDGEKATITATTRGNIVGLTRKAIVNDDLGAFNDVSTRLGRAAALSIEVDVYALIKLNTGLGPTQADAQPLFHSNRSNIGTSGAMSVATLDGSRAVMAAQKDPSGNEILDLRPAIWLGPVALGGQARVFNDAQYEPTANKFQVPNMVKGLFRDVVDTAQLTGTRHYLLADPAIAPVFAVAFIDGQESPEMVSENSFEFDGVQWRVRIDYGVAALDYRGAVTCPGA